MKFKKDALNERYNERYEAQGFSENYGRKYIESLHLQLVRPLFAHCLHL